MKLLLFSDLHNDVVNARRLVQMAARADVVVGAGDFCNMHDGLETCLAEFRSLGRPLVLVAGNNETTDELRAACRGWAATHVLHGSRGIVAGVTFFGLGGGIPTTPFGAWSYDFTEEQADALLAPCPTGCVLVSHSPPRGAADVSSRGRSLGSVAVRRAVERVRPRLVVCGHIHGSAGETAMLGETPVVNAGAYGVEWELA